MILSYVGTSDTRPTDHESQTMKAIVVVGSENGGVTSLSTQLIQALRDRGLSVSTIRHVPHDIDLDQPDATACRDVGAVDVVVHSDRRWALLHERGDDAGSPLADMMSRLSPVDVLLVEGFEDSSAPRIDASTVSGSTAALPPKSCDAVAMVTDGPDDPNVPSFRVDEIGPLADFMGDLFDSQSLRW